MAGYKWTPPPGYGTLQLEEGGKVYVPGDDVPISKAGAEQLVRAGHAFEGLDDPLNDVTAVLDHPSEVAIATGEPPQPTPEVKKPRPVPVRESKSE